jgi:hypothetical protein
MSLNEFSLPPPTNVDQSFNNSDVAVFKTNCVVAHSHASFVNHHPLTSLPLITSTIGRRHFSLLNLLR